MTLSSIESDVLQLEIVCNPFPVRLSDVIVVSGFEETISRAEFSHCPVDVDTHEVASKFAIRTHLGVTALDSIGTPAFSVTETMILGEGEMVEFSFSVSRVVWTEMVGGEKAEEFWGAALGWSKPESEPI